MKTPDYTKGNWKYAANTHNKVSPFFIQSGPHIIADMTPTLQNNTEANAQLIAAAPELAEALTWALTELTCDEEESTWQTKTDTVRKITDALIKAGYTL